MTTRSASAWRRSAARSAEGASPHPRHPRDPHLDNRLVSHRDTEEQRTASSRGCFSSVSLILRVSPGGSGTSGRPRIRETQAGNDRPPDADRPARDSRRSFHPGFSTPSLDRRPPDAVFAHVRLPRHNGLWRAVWNGCGKDVGNRRRLWGCGRRGETAGFPQARPQRDRGRRWLRSAEMEGAGEGSPHFHTLYYYY